MTDKPEDKLDHTYVTNPPGTATGWVCSKCGYRHNHPASKRRCGKYSEAPPVRAKHDFDPYAG